MDNLLANVRSHTPLGTAVEVRVGTDGDQAVVVVADQGPGLSEDEAGKVFERFFRSDPSRSREAAAQVSGCRSSMPSSTLIRAR